MSGNWPNNTGTSPPAPPPTHLPASCAHVDSVHVCKLDYHFQLTALPALQASGIHQGVRSVHTPAGSY